MRRQYLFLYPCRLYVDSLLKGRTPELTARALAFVNGVIDARYRQQGYTINWLTFSNEETALPNEASLSDKIRIDTKDRVLESEHALTSREYADTAKVLEQLAPADRLVVGGFHYLDCVYRFAAEAHQKEIPTFIDAHTTDYGFHAVFRNYPISQDTTPEPVENVIRDMKKLEELLHT